MAERGTIQKIADETGVNQATVRRALTDSGLTPGRGGYDFERAVEIVKANADPARIAGHAANGRGDGGNSDISTLAAANAHSATLRARKLEIEIASAEGRLVDRESVIESLQLIVGEARTAVLSIGARCASKLVGLTDSKKISKIIEDEMRIILEGLADDVACFERRELRALS